MKRTIVVVSIVMFLGTRGWSIITPPQSMPEGDRAYCLHGITPGYTETLNTGWVDLSSLQPYLNVLNSEPVESQFPGNWVYSAGSSSVAGSLAIPTYYPFDDDEHWPPNCTHGAQIAMSLSGLSGLAPGQQFQWLQYFTEEGDSGNRENTIDPPRTEVDEDDLPFYYNRNESQWGGMTFRDRPRDWMNEASEHSGGVSLVTFLCSWDDTDPVGEDPETVSIYGAVTWGYTFICVPEPSTLVFFGLGGVALMMGLRRRKQTA